MRQRQQDALAVFVLSMMGQRQRGALVTPVLQPGALVTLVLGTNEERVEGKELLGLRVVANGKEHVGQHLARCHLPVALCTRAASRRERVSERSRHAGPGARARQTQPPCLLSPRRTRSKR